MPKRSDTPSDSALRSRQSYELRNADCAFCSPIVSPAVIGMLVRDGKLPDRVHTDVEIDRAVTEYLFERAGDKIKFGRVRKIMCGRWQSAGN